MTVLGWISLLCSVGFVLGLTAWCYKRVLTLPPEDA